MKKLLTLLYLVIALAYSGTIWAQNTDIVAKNDTLLNEVLSQNVENKYKYYFYSGVSYKSLGQYDQAYEMFVYCIGLDDKRAEAYYELGNLNMQLKNYEKAIEYFKLAIKNSADNYSYNETLFFALYSQPELSDEAIAQLEKMVDLFPENNALQLQLIELYGQAREFDKLIALLNKIESKIGISEQISLQKYAAYKSLGNEKRAFDEIEKLTDAYPNDLRYSVIMANLYLDENKNRQALKILNQVLDKEPNNSLAIFSLSEYYNKVGDEERFLNQVEKIITDENQESDLRLNMMRQFIVKNESDSLRVIPLFEQAVTAIPDDDQMYMLYAQYLYSIEQQEKAYPILGKVLDIDPSNTATRLMMLAQVVSKNDFESVIQLCEDGILASPETIEFYYYLAIAYNQARESKKVLQTVEKALSIFDSNTPKELVSDFYAIQGDAYHELGDNKRVFDSYEKALEYYSENMGVLNNYAYYLSVERVELDKAEEMSRKTVEKDPKNDTFLDTYAWILFELKKYAEAKIYILQALENGGDKSGVILEHAGDIFYMLNEKEMALEYWNKALIKGGATDKLSQKIKRKKYID